MAKSMDKSASQRVPLIRLVAVLSLLSACRPGPYVTVSLNDAGLSVQAPSGWYRDELDPAEASFMSRDEDSTRQFGAAINVRPRRSDDWDFESLLKLRRQTHAGGPEYSLAGPSTFSLAGQTAWTYTMSRRKIEHMIAHPSPGRPAPQPLAWKETVIYVVGPDKSGYIIEYEAPLELYDKHKPHFDHLLATFQWSKK